MHDFQSDIAIIQSIDTVPRILGAICRTTGMGFAAVAPINGATSTIGGGFRRRNCGNAANFLLARIAWMAFDPTQLPEQTGISAQDTLKKSGGGNAIKNDQGGTLQAKVIGANRSPRHYAVASGSRRADWPPKIRL